MCDRFPIVAFIKLIVAFVNAFAIWPKKKKKAIVAFLKHDYRQILKKKTKGYSHIFKMRL